MSNGWTDWYQLCFTSADSSWNGHRLNPSRPSLPQGAFRGGGGGRGSQIQKRGEAVKRLHRLAPNLVHVGGFVWEWTWLNTIRSSIPQGVLWGYKFKSLGKLSNSWTDWHQIWYTSADSSGNGYTPNKLPFETQGGHLGVLGGQTLKTLEKLSNGWTDWHQLWFTSADSSGNGQRLNTIRPTIPQGALGGGGV